MCIRGTSNGGVPIEVCTHSTPSETTVRETMALSLPDFALFTDIRSCERYVGCD